MQIFDVAVFEGAGVGPEVMVPAVDLLLQLSAHSEAYRLSFHALPIGGVCADNCACLPTASIQMARKCKAILLSSSYVTGGTSCTVTPVELKRMLHLFAELHPVRFRPNAPTPLRLPAQQEVDFILLRQSGLGDYAQGHRTSKLHHIHDENDVELCRYAIELALARKTQGKKGKITFVSPEEETAEGPSLRTTFDAVAHNLPDIEIEYVAEDEMVRALLLKPWLNDVVLTDRKTGRTLSQLGTGLMGGAGIAPSALVGRNYAVFQPCHGIQPELAGCGVVNPFAMILSGAMMLVWLGLRYGIAEMLADAARLRIAVECAVSDTTYRTCDLGGVATTEQAANAVSNKLTAVA